MDVTAVSSTYSARRTARAEPLRHEPLPDPDEGERHAADGMDERGIARGGGIDVARHPEPEAIEAPRRRPREERTEEHPVDGAAEEAETDAIVVERQEDDAVTARDVLPVSGAAGDQGLRVVGPELERGRALAGGARPLADRLSL